MRKIFTNSLFGSAIAIAAIGIANAGIAPISDFLVKQTKHEVPAGFTLMDLKNPSSTAKKAVKAPKRALSTQQTSTLLFEDFSNVPDGEFVQTGEIGMRAVTPIANYDCGNFMNPEYTPNTGQWYGDWVFAGTGGTVILQAYNPMQGAMLQLPLNDYSGDLVVTMRARPKKAFWGSDNEVGFVTSAGGGTDIFLSANIGGFGASELANSELGYGTTIAKIYEKDGWVEAKTTFRNESANADGTLTIYLSDACEIDWIKVEDSGTYLAAPVPGDVLDFKETEFTVEWDDVRRSFNYYLDFFYAKWTADKGVDENYDFENGIPADFTAGGASVAEGEGMNGTTGMRIAEGEENAFATPTYWANLEECGIKFLFSQTMADEELYELSESELPSMIIEGLTEEGWRPVAAATIDGFFVFGNYYMSTSLSGEQFAGQYKSIRFYAKNTDDENYFVIDDFSAYAPRPYELERVVDPNPESEYGQTNWEMLMEYVEAGYMTEEEALETLNSPFNCWWITEANDPCQYTFKDVVEPDKEYFWRVRSHRLETINGNGNMFVGTDINHILGVAAPQLQDAKDIKADSYTACWNDVAKAQNYIVSNYVATEITEDTKGYTIFDETFANVEGETILDLYEPAPENLDELTDMPGWTGERLYVGQNAVGSLEGGMLNSPEIGIVENGKSYFVYFEAEGYYGDALVVQFNGLQTYGIIQFEEDGTVSGTIEVPTVVNGENISFYTSYGMPFAVKALEVTQDVDKGTLLRTFDSRQIVPAGVQQAIFSGLDENNKYAYNVVSNYKFEKNYVNSLPDHLFNIVDLKAGTSNQFSKVENIGEENIEVVARFTVDGLTAPEGYKGLVIEKLSNGKTRKVIVR